MCREETIFKPVKRAKHLPQRVCCLERCQPRKGKLVKWPGEGHIQLEATPKGSRS